MTSRLSDEIQLNIASIFGGIERIESRSGYWYRQYVPPLYAFIVVAHSTKYRCFEVDIASTVFPVWDRKYYTHQVRRATGLPFLRERDGTLRMENVPYHYKNDPSQAMTIIFDELAKFAKPWFETHRTDFQADHLVQYGLSLLQRNPEVTQDIDNLKQSLRKQADCAPTTMWQRRETKILAMDLIRWQQV